MTEATKATDPLDTTKLADTSKTPAPLKFKVKSHVTLPLLKILPEKPLYVKIEGAIFKAKEQAGARKQTAPDGTPMQQPPELAHVIDLTSGEHAQIIIGTVLGTELRETYPNDAYVGKSFEIVQHKVQGKRYATYGITEIEVEVYEPVVAAKVEPTIAAPKDEQPKHDNKKK